MNEPTQHTGEMIRRARKAAGLTQKELGERMGITVSAVTKMENRNAAHTVETLERVANALGKKLLIDFI